MTFEEWLSVGVTEGFCSQPCCATHDGLPMTQEEMDEFDAGYDPCQWSIRLRQGDEALIGGREGW